MRISYQLDSEAGSLPFAPWYTWKEHSSSDTILTFSQIKSLNDFQNLLLYFLVTQLSSQFRCLCYELLRRTELIDDIFLLEVGAEIHEILACQLRVIEQDIPTQGVAFHVVPRIASRKDIQKGGLATSARANNRN
jgi:hypothetical protein